MTMVNGPVLNLPWAKQDNHTHESINNATNNHISVKGALMIIAACLCWATFVILQVRYIFLIWFISILLSSYRNMKYFNFIYFIVKCIYSIFQFYLHM